MTWWSEHSAVPRFVLANSAIRCRFVDRFVGSEVPSDVSVQRFSTLMRPFFLRRVPSSAVPRHQRSYRGATTSRSHPPSLLWLRSRGPRAPPAFVLAEALPAGAEVAVGPGTIYGPLPVPAVAPVDASGTSQVPWRSVPCLCPAPGPRSSRRDLASGGLLDAAPGFHKPKASTGRKISRLTQGFSIRCLRFTSDVAATHARLVPAGGLRLYREGVEPSGPLRKVSGHISVPLSRAKPVASGVRSKSYAKDRS